MHHPKAEIDRLYLKRIKKRPVAIFSDIQRR
jgi:hypothetical protein